MRSTTTRCAPCLIHAAIALGLAAGAPMMASAAAPELTSGPVIELRYRHENVDDDAFGKEADADTVRVRIGYRWVFAPGWQLYADGEHVEAFAGEKYNSTANGKTEYPVVADPESSEINQAFIGYADERIDSAFGRQKVTLDNQRFFGDVGWRQNEQTFDAFSFSTRTTSAGPVLRYVYLDRVLRVFGHDNPNPLLREWSLNGNLFHLDQKLPLGQLAGYAYLVENDDIATNSTQTYGLRWTGSQDFDRVTLGWAAEYAWQSDWSNNPRDVSANYWLVEPSLEVAGIRMTAGWEVLGGDGDYGFSTPYATLHKFNGWADKFLATPARGLDDRYLGVSGKIEKAAWAITWHDFNADDGGDDYGSEWDASLSYPFGKHFKGLLKVADYKSDGFSSDTRKIWASLDYRY
jgi:hypothetical protein